CSAGPACAPKLRPKPGARVKGIPRGRILGTGDDRISGRGEDSAGQGGYGLGGSTWRATARHQLCRSYAFWQFFRARSSPPVSPIQRDRMSKGGYRMDRWRLAGWKTAATFLR